MITNVILNKSFAFVILTLIVTAFACSQGRKSEQNFGAKHWLIGSWQYYSGNDTISEIWSAEGDELIGVNTKLKGAKSIPNELISLRLEEGNYIYEVKVKDQNNGEGVPFKLKHFDAHEFVFENLEHDFPQKITYRMLHNDTCIASISGNINNEERKVNFKLFRVQP